MLKSIGWSPFGPVDGSAKGSRGDFVTKSSTSGYCLCNWAPRLSHLQRNRCEVKYENMATWSVCSSAVAPYGSAARNWG